MAAEKDFLGNQRVSVPKLTQVDEENILRRSGELRLRNSAKLIRNFGIRIASCRVRGLRPELEEATVKRPNRLFIKNTGRCEHQIWMYID